MTELHNRFKHELRIPGADRLWYIADAFRYGYTLEKVQTLTKIDPWFLMQIADLVQPNNITESFSLHRFNTRRIIPFKASGIF